MHETVDNLLQWLTKAVVRSVACLISEKHLYQSEKLDMEPIQVALHEARKRHLQMPAEVRGLETLIHMPWEPRSLDNLTRPIFGEGDPLQSLVFDLPHVKLFCPVCERAEAHNPFENVLHGGTPVVTGLVMPHAGEGSMRPAKPSLILRATRISLHQLIPRAPTPRCHARCLPNTAAPVTPTPHAERRPVNCRGCVSSRPLRISLKRIPATSPVAVLVFMRADGVADGRWQDLGQDM